MRIPISLMRAATLVPVLLVAFAAHADPRADTTRSPLRDEYTALYEESSDPVQWARWAADETDRHRAGLAEWLIAWHGAGSMWKTGDWREPVTHLLRAAVLLQSDEPVRHFVAQFLPAKVLDAEATFEGRLVALPLYLYVRDHGDASWAEQQIALREYTGAEIDRAAKLLSSLLAQAEEEPR